MPTEAFKTLPGDDKEVAAAYRKKNKEDLQHQKQASLDFTPELRGHLDAVLEEWQSLSALPEKTPAQIDAKKERFSAFAQGEHAGPLADHRRHPCGAVLHPEDARQRGESRHRR